MIYLLELLMGCPKLFGGNPGTGELFVLLFNIYKELKNFNLLSFVIGVGTVVIIMVAKKLAPKFPMSVVVMVLGALATVFFNLGEYGVKLLPKVNGGLPHFVFPDFSENAVGFTISVALSVVALLTPTSVYLTD